MDGEQMTASGCKGEVREGERIEQKRKRAHEHGQSVVTARGTKW